MENDINKHLLLAITGIVWKYGEVFVDENEIEFHIAKISFSDFVNFATEVLEVYHDEENMTSYYRVRKAN